MVYLTRSRVDRHRNGAQDLTEEDNQDGLPPIQPSANHDRAESPVIHRQTEVEEEIIPPYPCTGFWWCW